MSNERNFTVDQGFYWLFRFNAVGVFCLLIFAAFSFISFAFGSPEYGYDDTNYPDRFGHDKDKPDGEYKGEEYETPNGLVTVYIYGPEPNMDRGEVSTGVTLVQPATGRQLEVLADDEEDVLASFDVIENDAKQAVAYIARISTKEEYAEGRARLVAGSFTALKQVEVAENAPFLDSKVLTSQDQLALVFWSDEVTARTVLLDLTSMSIERAEEVRLPPAYTPELN